MTKLTEKLEVLAFGLYVRACDLSEPSKSIEELMHRWRSEPMVRQGWRTEADLLLDATKEAGLDIEAPSAPLRKFINKLVTQPASVMYTLEDEPLSGEPNPAK